jgi:glycosyltransferase involved in cell wall biosynthesis
MRVLYLSPYPPARDGIGNYTCLLANAVSDLGNEIAVIVPHSMANAPPEVIGSVRDSRHGPRDTTALIERWHPDVIHVQFAVAAFGSRTAWFLRWLREFRRGCRVPVVVTLHEVSRELALLPIAGPHLFRRIAAHCEHLIVHTNIALTTLTERLGVPDSVVSVIPHPITQPATATASPGDLRAHFALANTRVLLAFGFIHVDKGLDDLVRALSVIRQASPASLTGVRLVVAGAVRPRQGAFRIFELRDQVHFARVRQLVRRSGLDDLVVRTGYVPAGQVAAWFELADAVVLPYRRAEQSGVAGLARSLNVTVLASRAGGLGELFAGSPWTFAAGSPTELAATITEFLAASPSGRGQPGGQLRSDDLSSVAASTLAVYRSLLRSA